MMENLSNEICIELNDKSISKELFKAFINSGKEEIIIVNVGTDRCVGDSLGPLIGTLLENNGTHIKTYGTLSQPIHALNVNNKINTICENHPNAFIIATDAALGETDHIRNIYLKNKPISPGAGMEKELKKIGDYSITGIVESVEDFSFISLQKVRLSMVFEMANKIAKELLLLDNLIKDYFYNKEKNNYEKRGLRGFFKKEQRHCAYNV